jgi:hypothetical protein
MAFFSVKLQLAVTQIMKRVFKQVKDDLPGMHGVL